MESLQVEYKSKQELLIAVRDGKHHQFSFDKKTETVKCKCGAKAVWWKTGFLCSSITARPCKY